MKKIVLISFAIIVGFAQEKSMFITNNKVQFKSDLAEHRAKYKQHQSEHKARKKEAEAQQQAHKIFLNKNSLQVPRRSAYIPQTSSSEGLLKSFDKSDNKDKLFQKLLIKSRSKKNPEKYHYTVVKKKSDLKKAGVVVGKKSKIKKVYNYVEVKNTFGKKKNIGVEVEKGSKVKEVVNIVNVKHSKILEDNVNAGVRIKSKKVPKKVYNTVELKDSKIGEW